MRSAVFGAVGLVVVLVLSGLALATPGSAAPGVASSPVGASSSSSAPVSSLEVQVAPGYALARGDRSLGPPNASSEMDVLLGLPLRDPGGLADYLNLLYTPGSPEYHAYLSDAELAATYGASAADVSSALAYFAGQGLDARLTPDRLMIEVSGPTGEMAAAFHTQFDRVVTSVGTSFLTHLSPAELPASVAVTGVLGLGNVSPIQPDITEVAGADPLAGPAASCAGASVLTPCQVWGAYDLADDLANGTDGAGLTIAVVDAYDSSETQSALATDLGTFDGRFALPTPQVHFLYPVPTTTDLNTSSSSGWGLEESLDLEWAHATAPGATIDMTLSPNSGIGLYEAVDDLVADQRANVISLSWGEPDVGVYNAFSTPCSAGCNASTDGSYAILSPVLEFAAAEGISVFAATGDCGAADGTSGVATNYPASDPYVTGVGGTDLDVSDAGVYSSETGWDGNQTGAHSPGCENQGGSGGGYSPFPRPAWQTGPGLTVGTTRGDPDVSAVSAPGVQIESHGEALGVEGTSVATPIWAGIAAVADQAHGAPLGFLDPALYRILDSPTLYAQDFHDIVTGNNGYAAGTGWDPVTGIGTPIVGALVPDLSGGAVGISNLSVHLAASATSGAAPLTVTFDENVSGGSGTYPIEGVYFGDGTAAAVSAGAVRHVYSTPGVYPAVGYAWDSTANVSDSVPIAIVVGLGSTLSVELNASATSVATGVADTLNASVTGGLAPYTFDFSFGDGTFLNDTSSAVVTHAYAAAGGYCAVVIVSDSAVPPDGGESLPLAISVGGAPTPSCSLDRGTLTLTVETDVPVRDAPADFPALFHVTGGDGTFSESLVATDPYVAACGCTIFRAAGTYSVSIFVNASGGVALHAETNVTVAPPLQATFQYTPQEGGPPLQVEGHVTVSGGYGADATSWSSGSGGSATGDWVNFTYASAGDYWLVAHVEDRGEGNASWAGLVEVASAPSVIVNATIGPVVDLDSGTTIDFRASTLATGFVAFEWQLGPAASALGPIALRTYYAPSTGASSAELSGTLNVSVEGGPNVTVPFSFPDLFAVESGGFVPAANALVLADASSPAEGLAPYNWSGSASVTGPGSDAVTWTFSYGYQTGPAVAPPLYGEHVEDDLWPGEITVQTMATDGAGDLAYDVHGFTGSAGVLTVNASIANSSGLPPLGRNLEALVTGGVPPYLYEWDFGDSSAANTTVGMFEYHAFPGPGVYDVRVEVVDFTGGSVEGTVAVDISQNSTSSPAPGLTTEEILGIGVAAGVVIAVGLVLVVRRRGRRPPVTP